MTIAMERLLNGIGELDDIFLAEAEMMDFGHIKSVKRKRIAKYSAAGLVVSVGVAMAYFAFRPKGAKRIAA